jgi:nicotinamide phosphoribosyltransferase
VLDSHIGAIYGDSITLDRAEQIFTRLEAKGFASTNIVLGIGSFTYQYNTRDTFGFAMKATYVEVDGEGREIFKDPITDDGTKKSATGLLHVAKNPNGGYFLIDKVDWDVESVGELQNIYIDGEFFNQTSLEEVRTRLRNS